MPNNWRWVPSVRNTAANVVLGGDMMFVDGTTITTGQATRGVSVMEGSTEMAKGELTELKQSAVAIDQKKPTHSVELLKELGFEALHKMSENIATRAMKENMIGLAGYKKIEWKRILEASTRIGRKSDYNLALQVTRVEDYLGQHSRVTPGGLNEEVAEDAVSLPPMDVLEKMSAAKKEGLFDSFAIIHVAKVHDPILVGRIKDVNDVYMIAEWGDDITFDEIMK